MRIRLQLAVLVLAAVAPVAIFAGITTFQLWQLKREASGQQFLERVGALRLALDTELEGTIRILRSLADSSDFDRGAAVLQAHAHFERLTTHGPGWIAMGFIDIQGDTPVRVEDDNVPKDIRLDESTIAIVRSTRAPAVSNLVAFGAGRALVTFVAVPVLRADALNGIIYVGIEHRGWLDFFNRLPVADGGTLTRSEERRVGKGGQGVVSTDAVNGNSWSVCGERAR